MGIQVTKYRLREMQITMFLQQTNCKEEKSRGWTYSLRESRDRSTSQKHQKGIVR